MFCWLHTFFVEMAQVLMLTIHMTTFLSSTLHLVWCFTYLFHLYLSCYFIQLSLKWANKSRISMQEYHFRRLYCFRWRVNQFGSYLICIPSFQIERVYVTYSTGWSKCRLKLNVCIIVKSYSIVWKMIKLHAMVHFPFPIASKTSAISFSLSDY